MINSLCAEITILGNSIIQPPSTRIPLSINDPIQQRLSELQNLVTTYL